MKDFYDSVCSYNSKNVPVVESNLISTVKLAMHRSVNEFDDNRHDTTSSGAYLHIDETH